METCLRMRQGRGQAQQSRLCHSLFYPTEQHSLVLALCAGWFGTRQHQGNLPQHASPPAPAAPHKGHNADRRQGITHRSEPLLLRVGWLRLTSRDPWGGRRRLSPTVISWHAGHCPITVCLLINPALGPERQAPILLPWGRRALAPTSPRQEPGLQLGHPGCGAAGGRAGHVSSADPAG